MTVEIPFADLSTLAGLKVLLVGLAREGCAAARFLAEHGAQVAVTDTRPAAELTAQLKTLQDLEITFHLGGHPETLLDPAQTDLLVVSPGVPLTIPFLNQARARGLPLTTETRLFCHFCPAPIVGISGSSGKTTTTTLVGLMLKESGYNTHVGGNIGNPLITNLGDIQRQDWVVMELSSFQLEYFHPSPVSSSQVMTSIQPLLSGWSPAIGALLNITPNHLDRHGTMAAYIRAKQALVAYMGRNQTAILSFDNPTTRQLAAELRVTMRWFSLKNEVEEGACLIGDTITLIKDHQPKPVCPVTVLKLRGEHNIANILAACAIAEAAGATVEAIAAVATSFTGVSHRLELVTRQKGVAYYNDSIATSPERLMAALRSFDEPLILLAGGKDKNLPWDEAARLIGQRVKHLVLFGQAADLIDRALQQAQSPNAQTQVHHAYTLERAVAKAKHLAQPGDVVLLSPGCASFDAYVDFAARGEHFRALVLNK